MNTLADSLREALNTAQNRHILRAHHPGGCGIKARYSTVEAAMAALGNIQRKRSHDFAGKAETRSYYCPQHRAWHLTSKPAPHSTRARRPLLVWKIKWDGSRWQASHVKSGGCKPFLTWDEAITYVIADVDRLASINR